MAPSKATSSWDEESSSDESADSPQAVPVARRGKFDDEEDEDVLDDWEEGEDSEVEREKAKVAAEAKAKADAAAKAAKKPKGQRIEERIEEKRRMKESLLEDYTSEEEEDESERMRAARENEKESDLRNAEDLFAGIGVSDKRGNKPVTVADEAQPGTAIDLSSLSLFKPSSAAQFAKLRETLVPLLTANTKKPQYAMFMPELVKQLCKDLNSEQIKKVAAGLNTMSNEKMKEEKAADKGGKKSKAAKTKTSLNANRDVTRMADTAAYDDGLDDGDFM